MNIEHDAVPPSGGGFVTEKYAPIYNLAVRDPETKKGEAVVLPIEEHRNISGSLIPRWNRDFAPMHWVTFRDWRAGKRVVVIQRDH